MSTEEILFFDKEELLNEKEEESYEFMINFKAFNWKISAIRIEFPYMVIIDINGNIIVYDLSDIFNDNMNLKKL